MEMQLFTCRTTVAIKTRQVNPNIANALTYIVLKALKIVSRSYFQAPPVPLVFSRHLFVLCSVYSLICAFNRSRLSGPDARSVDSTLIFLS